MTQSRADKYKIKECSDELHAVCKRWFEEILIDTNDPRGAFATLITCLTAELANAAVNAGMDPAAALVHFQDVLNRTKANVEGKADPS